MRIKRLGIIEWLKLIGEEAKARGIKIQKMGLEDFTNFLKKDCPSPDNHKISSPEEDLVMCDFKECIERGQYIRCYFDLYKNCEIYRKREFYKKE